VAVVALVIALLGAGGRDSRETSSRPVAPAPADAPLERQLDALEQAVRDAQAR
jgi:hypothetical protein